MIDTKRPIKNPIHSTEHWRSNHAEKARSGDVPKARIVDRRNATILRSWSLVVEEHAQLGSYKQNRQYWRRLTRSPQLPGCNSHFYATYSLATLIPEGVRRNGTDNLNVLDQVYKIL
jgi:hypothetical protein